MARVLQRQRQLDQENEQSESPSSEGSQDDSPDVNNQIDRVRALNQMVAGT